MDVYSYRKQPYQSNLTKMNILPNGSLPTSIKSTGQIKKRELKQYDSQSLKTPTKSSFMSFNKGPNTLHIGTFEIDSDHELDHAKIQSASKAIRRQPVKIPFLTPSTSASSRKSNNNNKSGLDSPFYSTVVEPQMNLGQQYPVKSNTFKKVVQGDKRHTPKELSSQVSLINKMTLQIVETYENCSSDYNYKSINNPKRVLTKPSKEARNDGYDNEDCDYILKVNDILGEEKEYQYRVIDLLGQGTFGQVVKCERITTGDLVSVKVIKNKVAYRAQSRMEVEILKQLNSKLDSSAQKHILTLHHTFTHKNHFCLVFELLSFNLYELIKQNQFRGLTINLVRVFTLQLLDTLILLKDANIIHCDLKPENILLTSIDTPIIKVIDFGSACHEAKKMYTYIQSRFYRSPEILLGVSYSGSIDMWSLGCIIAELFIGIPLFPGSSEYNQLRRIVDMLGMPPQDMLDRGSNSHDFFNKESTGNGKYIYTMKSLEQYGMEHNKAELPGKKYYAQTELPDLILHAKSTHQPTENIEQDLEQRHALIDLLQGLLEINPLKRWTPQQARHHPFVTGQPFTEPYDPTKNVHNKLFSFSNKNKASSSSEALNTINESQLNTKDNVQYLENNKTNNIDHRAHINTNESIQPRRQRAQSMNAPTLPSQVHDLVLDMQAHPIIEHHPLQHEVNNNRNNNISHNNHSRTTTLNSNHHINHNKNSNNSNSNKTSTSQNGFYKHRHARSQGDLVGLLSPENHNPSSHNVQHLGFQINQQQQKPSSSTVTTDDDSPYKHSDHSIQNHMNEAILPKPTISNSSSSRKVKIAPKVKIRIGSRESYQQADVMHNDDSSSSDIGSKLTSLSHNSNGDWLLEPTLSSLHALSNKTKPKGHLSHEGEAAGGLLMMRQQQDKMDGSSLSSSSSGKRGMAAAFKRTLRG
ncbi:unnamed protein product [Cunninghamella blakesleeana]